MTSIWYLTSSLGLQTQSNTNPIYKGPFDAMKKIVSQHGVAGLFKGQCVTFLREATGYGVYFLAYEKLIQREMTQKGIRRDQISPMNPILYGAAAGYAVSSPPFRQHLRVVVELIW
jgi:solute carrier family 25 carnitine/acylcarnitine transporter 20/29